MASHISNGTVLAPRTGCEEHLEQMFNLDIESHFDENDACVYLIKDLAD